MLYSTKNLADIAAKVKCRMVNFWAQLRNGDQSKFSSIMFLFMKHLQEIAPDKFPLKWTNFIKHILNAVRRFGDIWVSEDASPLWLKTIY